MASAAQRTENSTTLRVLARGGYAASGVIHMLIGALAITVVFGDGSAEADQVGVLKRLASFPLGLAALWAIASLLGALGVFHLVHGFALRRRDQAKRWGRRFAEWGQGTAFIVMAGSTVAIATGARPDPDESTQDVSRGLLTAPGGLVLLMLIGLGVVVTGVVWVVMGSRRSFRKKLSLPKRPWRSLILALGSVGFISKGLAFGVIGVFLVIAGIEQDPSAAGALDAAFSRLRELPGGEWLLAGMGAGFIAYGVFCMFRARFADLSGARE